MTRRLCLYAAIAVLSLGLSSWTFAQDSSAQSGGAASGSTAKQGKKAKGGGAASDQSQSGDQGASADKGGAAKKGGGMDATFVKKAAEGGLAEVALGQMAQQKGQSDDVKQFGQRMVTDHTKANDELKSLAQQKSWTLPSDLSAKDKAEQQRLDKLSGAEFDKAYMKHMVMDHTKDVSEFRRASKSASDTDLKQWAGKTLPTLEDHLKQAKEVNAKTGGGAAAGGEKGSKKSKGAGAGGDATKQ